MPGMLVARSLLASTLLPLVVNSWRVHVVRLPRRRRDSKGAVFADPSENLTTKPRAVTVP
jgi:hypothetical protein